MSFFWSERRGDVRITEKELILLEHKQKCSFLLKLKSTFNKYPIKKNKYTRKKARSLKGKKHKIEAWNSHATS